VDRASGRAFSGGEPSGDHVQDAPVQYVDELVSTALDLLYSRSIILSGGATIVSRAIEPLVAAQ